MNNIEIIRSFYNNYKYLQLKRGYKSTLDYQVIYTNKTSNANLIYEDKKLKLLLGSDTELSIDLLNTIGYFFPNYDYDNDTPYIHLQSGINLFFYEGTKRLNMFGVKLNFCFDELTKRKFIYSLLKSKEWILARYGREKSGMNGYQRYGKQMSHLKNTVSCNRVTYSFWHKVEKPN